MKAIKLIIALLLLATAGMGTAWADHHGGGHVRFGLMIGPMWGPWYYPPPAYYYPPYYSPLVVERPQVYVEQQPAPAVTAPAASSAPPPTNYWYYCAASKGYYPYVKTCRGGWQRVSPQPPGEQ